MGKSALPIVASQQIPVYPRKGVPIQPAYTRSKRSIQTSSRLKAFQSCVASKMSGKTGSRMDIRAAFTSAAKGCKGA